LEQWVEEQQEEAEQQQEEYENQKYQYEYGEEPPLIGARGEGCSSNYGEYMSKSINSFHSENDHHLNTSSLILLQSS
jgi:hypothetical protein